MSLPTLDVMDSTGHMSITWDPDDPDQVARAAAEFQRLREAGYLLFASRTEFDPHAGSLQAGLPPAPAPEADVPAAAAPSRAPRRKGLREVTAGATDLEQTESLRPRSRRHVAVPRMRGG